MATEMKRFPLTSITRNVASRNGRVTLWAWIGCGALVATLVGCGSSSIPPSVRPNVASMMQIREQLQVGGGAVEEEVEQIEFGNQFATLRGKITLNGSAPSNPTLKVDKDLAVCKPGGSDVIDQVVVTGGDGGLANVLIFADVPEGWCHESQIGKSGTVDFDQKNCLFLNRIFPMQTTQTLRILNSDTVGHNAAMKPSKNPEYNPNIAGGGDAIYPPGGGSLREEKAPFPVNCAAHPWMQSYIIFRGNGYFDVTAEDGQFELPNLPAGVPVKITVWHEATKGVPGSAVAVQPSGVADGWSKRGAFTVTLDPDSETELAIAVDGSALVK